MTTIATDGFDMAGDGLVTGNGLKHMNDCRKVHRLKSGAVVGFSGCAFVYDEALEYLNGDREEIDFGEGFEAIILHAPGHCECMDGKGRRYRQSVPCVTGSGGAVALGAMAAGASPAEAVAIAIRYDGATGGEITTLRVEPIARAA
jgi:ATP-dependent protease HslVU (ClpYQ) peptidase subunit